MKTNIKLKDFLDKENLQKTLETKVKKAVMALSKNQGTPLPFQYEYGYFDDGSSFLSVGVAKELYNTFKKQRSKGQGKDKDGKPVKVDKKKVAYGQITLNEDGVYDFLVEGGLLKKMQLKQAIKDWGIYKKQIGGNFAILDKAPVPTTEETSEAPTEEETPDTTGEEPTTDPENTTNTSNDPKKRALRDKKQQKIKEGADKIGQALGRTDADKIKASITKLQQALEKLEQEAMADGEIDAEEQAQIDECKAQLQALQEHQERLGDKKIKMTPKNRQAVQDQLAQAKAYLEKVKAEIANG